MLSFLAIRRDGVKRIGGENQINTLLTRNGHGIDHKKLTCVIPVDRRLQKKAHPEEEEETLIFRWSDKPTDECRHSCRCDVGGECNYPRLARVTGAPDPPPDLGGERRQTERVQETLPGEADPARVYKYIRVTDYNTSPQHFARRGRFGLHTLNRNASTTSQSHLLRHFVAKKLNVV